MNDKHKKNVEWWMRKKEEEFEEIEATARIPKIPDLSEPDPITACIGAVGLWQVLVSIPLILANWMAALHLLVMIFQNQEMNYTCAGIKPDQRCSKPCEEFKYDRSIFEETIVSEWGLTCENGINAAMSQSSIMGGAVLGTIITALSGLRGQEKMYLLVSANIILFLDFGMAFVPSFWLFIAMKTCVGVYIGTVMVITRDLIMDIFGPSLWCEIFLMLYQLSFDFGFLFLPLIAYFVRHWMLVQIIISLLALLNIICFMFVPDSARWLLFNGGEQKAIYILKKAAEINKRDPTAVDSIVYSASRKKVHTIHPLQILRYPYMQVKIYSLYVILFSCGLTFFGMAEYIGRLPGDVFFNVLSAALVCIPGTFLAFVLGYYISRRITLLIALLSSAIGLMLLVMIPDQENDPISLIISVVVIFFTSLCFPTIYIYAWEIFPTCIRSWAMRISHCFYFLGGQIATFLIFTRQRNTFMLPIFIGALSFYATILCALLPESKNKLLVDTIEESEHFGLKKR